MVSKVLKRLICDKVIDFPSPSLSTYQFGFLLEKSTLQQLLVFLHVVHYNLLEKIQTNVIYVPVYFAKLSTEFHMMYSWSN